MCLLKDCRRSRHDCAAAAFVLLLLLLVVGAVMVAAEVLLQQYGLTRGNGEERAWQRVGK